jgi:branched-chain amino acid transport system permease protein
MLALHQFVTRTKWGMAMRAMAYDYVVVPWWECPSTPSPP